MGWWFWLAFVLLFGLLSLASVLVTQILVRWFRWRLPIRFPFVHASRVEAIAHLQSVSPMQYWDLVYRHGYCKLSERDWCCCCNVIVLLDRTIGCAVHHYVLYPLLGLPMRPTSWKPLWEFRTVHADDVSDNEGQ